MDFNVLSLLNKLSYPICFVCKYLGAWSFIPVDFSHRLEPDDNLIWTTKFVHIIMCAM